MLLGLVVTLSQVFSGGGKSEKEEFIEDKSDGAA
jgi:hypothetical protein